MDDLKIGQSVYWHDPDDGLCSNYGVIIAIEGDVVTLDIGHGEQSIVEALAHELEEA